MDTPQEQFPTRAFVYSLVGALILIIISSIIIQNAWHTSAFGT